MERLGKNVIGESKIAPFFKISNPDAFGLEAPALRRGDAVRTWVRSLSGFQKEAMTRSAASGCAWRLVSDEGPYLNGHDAAPCPLAFFTVGMAASFMNEIMALASMRGVEVKKLRLIQNNYYTMKGSMLKRTMIGGAENVDLQVEIDCDLDDSSLHGFLVEAICASPLDGLMRGELESLFRLSRNGVELPAGRVAELNAPVQGDPGVRFDEAAPEAGGPVLMKPVGMTPKKEVALGTAAASSSLADEQNRRLNVAAAARMRDDGIKEIQQFLYSPHGTSFRFLSSEDGRAPDANSYLSAGVAFCFMTQFGRFASMMKLDLPEYRIVQDCHFSLGGASGGTGKAGKTDPVETHVHLTTSESDEIAREMLDISEQTCFLHAFCRTGLKTKMKAVRI